MKKLLSLIIVIGVIAGIFGIVNLTTPKIWEKNESNLKQLLIKEADGALNLENYTPFRWDKIYIFKPHTANQTIYKTVGYEWGKIKDNDNASSMQVVFMKDNEVVCYSHGEAVKNGYYITTRFAENEQYVVANSAELRLVFLSQEQGYALLDFKRASMYTTID